MKKAGSVSVRKVLHILVTAWLSVCGVLVPAIGRSSSPAASEAPPVLASIGEIRALSQEEASRGLPLTVRAVVTFAGANGDLLFVQDGAAGIFIGAPHATNLRFGQLVEITGITGAGDFRPVIDQAQFKVIGSAGPPPAKRVTLAQLRTLKEDCRFVQVEGTVRGARLQDHLLLLWIGANGVTVGAAVELADESSLELSDFLDADVTVTGVCQTTGLRNGGRGVIIRVPQPQYLLRNRAPDPPEAVPLWTAKGLSELSVAQTPVHRVRIQGKVVSWGAGRPLLVQDDTGSVEVLTPHPPTAGPGESIEVVGFLRFGRDPERGVVLREGQILAAPQSKTGSGHSEVSKSSGMDSEVTAAPKPMPVLTAVADIHRLSQGEAARGYPVRVRAVVTYFDPDWQLLFVQDSSGGVFVEHHHETWAFEVGQKIEIEGVSGRGGFAPTIVPSRIRTIGHTRMPPARPSTFEDLLNGQEDSLLVEVRGMVRSVALDGSRMRLDLATGRGRFRAIVPNMTNVTPPMLEDGVVRVQGVCGTIMNSNGQLTGIRIFVPHLEAITVEEPGAIDPLDLPPTKVADILRFTPFTGAGHRIRVEGTVTLQNVKGEFLYVSDGDSAVRVETRRCPVLKPGDQIRVIGFPVVGAPNPHLEDSIVNKLDAGPTPTPHSIDVRRIIAGEGDGQLVSLKARLLATARVEDEQILTLQADDTVFNARMPLEPGTPDIDLPLNSLLTASGVTTILVDEEQRPRSFRLLLRSPQDVVLISAPPWLQVRHLLMFVVGLGVLIVLALIWVGVLRKRVREQTALIRQRLEREAALEERYRQLFGNANDLIQSVGADGRFRYVNPAWMRLLGFNESDLAEITHLDIIHPSSRRNYLEVFEGVLHGGSTGQFETVFVARDGREIIVEGSCAQESVHGQPAAVQGIFRDVTERKRAETELLLSEERFSKAFQNAPMAIGIMTRGDHCLLDVNEGFLKLWGYARYEIIAETDRMLGLWEDIAEWDRLFQRHREGRPVRDREMRIRTKSGESRTVLLSVEDVEIGNEPCLLLIAHDVTARLNLEAQLRQAQKMESVGRLAAGVAHDFNNILTVIQGHSELLLADPRLDSEYSEALRQVAEAAERGAEFTRQLLTFSRKQVLQRRPLDIGDVIHGMTPLLKRLVGESVELRMDFAPVRPVEADPGMIEQLLMNLAVNARDALESGGTITISLGSVKISPAEAARRSEASVGTFTCLRVSDNGVGMDSEVLEHIFDPFFTTKEVGKGTGLGLSMVYAIVKQHAGWVDVTSRPGGGTTFAVFLPTCAEGAVAVDSFPCAGSEGNGTETVLVVEDESSVRGLVGGLLRDKGYRILEAENGVRALEIWATRGDTVDLLLSDMVMPGGISGLDLARQFKQERPELKVLLTSGYSDESLGLDFSAMDGIDFMSKPYHPDELARRVRSCLDAGRLSPEAN
ncbi:MAG: PAS domain S-box protein [Acidobacteriota bacterium]